MYAGAGDTPWVPPLPVRVKSTWPPLHIVASVEETEAVGVGLTVITVLPRETQYGAVLLVAVMVTVYVPASANCRVSVLPVAEPDVTLLPDGLVHA